MNFGQISNQISLSEPNREARISLRLNWTHQIKSGSVRPQINI